MTTDIILHTGLQSLRSEGLSLHSAPPPQTFLEYVQPLQFHLLPSSGPSRHSAPPPQFFLENEPYTEL